MKLLFKIIIGLLAVIGALTLALAAYLYFADPFGLKNLLWPSPATPGTTAESPSGATVGGYDLSPAQELFLEKVGIDPKALPSTISPELEQCLVNAVGEERAQEIKAGAIPTPMDLLKAKPCLTN